VSASRPGALGLNPGPDLLDGAADWGEAAQSRRRCAADAVDEVVHHRKAEAAVEHGDGVL
jgi:hypothetical protein